MREKWVPRRLEVGQEGVAAEEPLKGRQDAGQGRSVPGIWKLRCCQMPRWTWGAGHTLKKSLELGTPPHPGGWRGQGGRKPGGGGQTEAAGATASKKGKWSAQPGFWIPCWDNSGGGRGCSSLIRQSYPHPYLTPFRVGFFTLLPPNRPSDPARL